MTQTMQSVEAGDLAARAQVADGSDEVGRLAGHLDRLLDTIDDKTRALQASHDDLDRKVVERTRELQSAQAHLIKSEKLAAIGQLTAGIAHEVNNPIAVIQGNLDLLRETLGRKAKPVQAELKLVDEQIERMRLIVTRLLQYARPGEYAGYVEPIDTEQAITDSLVLVQHLLSRTHIAVQRDGRATRRALINRQELQQVLINAIVNAIQAMPDGGTLTLATRDAGEVQIEIDIADTGPGFAAGSDACSSRSEPRKKRALASVYGSAEAWWNVMVATSPRATAKAAARCSRCGCSMRRLRARERCNHLQPFEAPMLAAASLGRSRSRYAANLRPMSTSRPQEPSR